MATVTFNGIRLNDADSSTSWSNFGSGGGPSPASEPQLKYQGTGAVNRKVTNTTSRSGVAYTHSTAQDMVNGAYPLWVCKMKVGDAGDLNTTYGCEASFGSASGNRYSYNLSGSAANNDQFIAGYSSQGGLAEGYIIAAINPNVATWRESTTGSPNLNSVTFFAIGAQFVTGGAKSENVACDAIDLAYGLDYTGSSFSFQDGVDEDQGIVTNRWGLACANGTIITLRGKHVLGAGGASIDGVDESSVVFPDGYHNVGDYGIEVDLGSASTNLELAGNYEGLGTLYEAGLLPTQPDINVTNSSGTLLLSGTFSNFRNMNFTSGVTVTGSINIFKITQNGSTIDGARIGTFAGATGNSWLDVPDFTLITNTLFIQNGLGHVFEITTSGTHTLNNLSYFGYGANGTDSAVFYNNSGGLVTLNVVGGTTPTFKNGAGATTVINNSVTITFSGIPDGLEIRIRQGTKTLAHEQNITGNQYSYVYNYISDTVVTVTIGGVANDGFSYERQTLTLTLGNTSRDIPLEFSLNPSYE